MNAASRRLHWVFAAVALLSCALLPPLRADSRKSQQPVGIVFGTYTRSLSKEHFRKETLMFRQVGGRKSYSVGIKLMPFGKVTVDFQDEHECGSLFYFELPPGEYEFFDCSATQDTLGGPFTYRSDANFSIRFAVEEGRSNYIGSIRIIKKISAFRTPLSGAAEYAFTYQEERDWQLLKRLHPDVAFPFSDAFPLGGDVPAFIQLNRDDAAPDVANRSDNEAPEQRN